MIQPSWKTVWQFLQKFNIKLPCDLTVSLPPKSTKNKESNKYTCICIHGSTVHSHRQVEAAHMSINRWVDTQTVVYTHSGIVFGHKNE